MGGPRDTPCKFQSDRQTQEWQEWKCFSQPQFSTDHAHLFTPCEFQSDRTTLNFWPKSCRTARRLDSGQLGWVLGRLGCVLGPLDWVLCKLGWVLGPLGW